MIDEGVQIRKHQVSLIQRLYNTVFEHREQHFKDRGEHATQKMLNGCFGEILLLLIVAGFLQSYLKILNAVPLAFITVSNSFLCFGLFDHMMLVAEHYSNLWL